MNNRHILKPGFRSGNFYFIIDFKVDVELIRKDYTKFNNYYFEFFYSYYSKFLFKFGKIYIKNDNYYLNLLSNNSLDFLSMIGIVYVKPYKYRIYLLIGDFVNDKCEGKCVLDILITIRLDKGLFPLKNCREGVFDRSKICFYDLSTTYEEFKKNFTVLGVRALTEDPEIYIYSPLLYEIEFEKVIRSDMKPCNCNDCGKFCYLFFNYLKSVE